MRPRTPETDVTRSADVDHGARARLDVGYHALDHLRSEAIATATTGAALGATVRKAGTPRTTDRACAPLGEQAESSRVIVIRLVRKAWLNLASLEYRLVDFPSPATNAMTVFFRLTPPFSVGHDLGDAFAGIHGRS